MNKPENNNTQTPFLKQIAQHYSTINSVEDFCFVFPNRRSGQFFLKYIEEVNSNNCLHPYVTTISDFISDNVDYTLATPTELIFNLYLAFCEVTNNHDYEFDKFIHWGNILISDFNDIDLYMVDAKQLFTNIADWKDISTDYIPEELKEELSKLMNIKFDRTDDDSFWRSSNNDIKGDVHQKFISLWSILYPLYQTYNANLDSKRLSYPGKMLKEFALKIKDISTTDLEFKKYIFVGFNLLSTSEMMVFDAFKKKGISEFHWDYASPALKNIANKGHKHIDYLSRRYKSSFSIDAIDTFPSNINIVGIPSNVGQTKYAFSIVENLIQNGKAVDSNKDFDTAIVLPDEGLFTTLTNSVPKSIQNINATLGISLRNSDISTLIRNISKVHKNAYRPNTEECFRFYKEFVKEVLSHPIIKSIYPKEVTEIGNYINSINDFYVSESYLKQTGLSNIFTTISDTKDKTEIVRFINRLITLCEDINEYYTIDDESSQLSLQSTFAIQYIDILNETKGLINEYGIPMCESSVFYLFDKLASLYTIPFEGEPLSGLQIMGMLETRNLDFDNLIILSMNERIFPRKFYKSSFIPPNMRRYFMMSTTDEQESISAYYFYRLISRAKNVYMLYDTSASGIGSSEYSRFISQLEMVYGCKLKYQNITLQVKPESKLPISVEKDDVILNVINKYKTKDSGKYLSASSIKTLIKCPLKFYLNHIEGLDDENEESLFMDYATFGTIVHNTLESLYYPECIKKNEGQNKVTRAQIKEFKKSKLEKELIRQVNTVYLKKSNPNEPLIGETAITMKALKYYANQVLDYDIQLLKNDDDFFMVYACEIDRIVQLTFGNHTFNFKYKIDRVDRINDEGAFRIIDYKTGKDKISFTKIESIFSNNSNGNYLAIMQLLIYCCAYKADNKIDNIEIQPIIYGIKENNFSGITYNKHIIQDFFSEAQLKEDFEEQMGELINEFFDKTAPFSQCEDNNNAACKYCRFIEFCRR